MPQSPTFDQPDSPPTAADTDTENPLAYEGLSKAEQTLRRLKAHDENPQPPKVAPIFEMETEQRELQFTELGFMRGLKTYKTIKFQVVEEPILAVIAAVIKVVVLVYVFFMLTKYHQYNVMTTPTSVMSFWGASKCNDDKTKCTYKGTDEDFCDGNGVGADYICAEPDWTYLDNTCRDFLMGEVVKKDADQVRVTTFATTTTKSDTGAKEQVNYFTPHADMIPVTVQHTFYVPNEVGFEEWQPGPHSARTVIFGSDGAVFKEIEAPPAGTAVSIELSLGQWLQLAGVSGLDEANPAAMSGCSSNPSDPRWSPQRVPSYRVTGVGINVKFMTTNEHVGIGSMGNTEPVTEVRVEKVPSGWSSFGSAISYLTDYPSDVVDTYEYGVRLKFSSEGNIAAFDFSVLMNSITTYLVMLGFASVVCDFCLAWVFGMRSKVYKDSKHDLLDKGEIDTAFAYKLEKIAADERAFAMAVFDKHAEQDKSGAGDGAEGEAGVVGVGELEAIVLELEDPELRKLKKQGDDDAFQTALNEIVPAIDAAGDGRIDREDFIRWWVARKQAEQD